MHTIILCLLFFPINFPLNASKVFFKVVLFLWPCLLACGILVPQPGTEPMLLVSERVESQSLDLQGSLQGSTFFFNFLFCTGV